MRRFPTALAIAGIGLVLTACGDPKEVRTANTTTTTGAASTTGAPPTTAECETVGFTPNSEDAASSITAAGVSCEEARAFVEVAGRQTSSGGPPQLDVQGYRCVRTRSLQDPLPQAFYECTKGGTKVTFVRS